ncbi:phage virion morphogenesis protein [Actinobacillus lignieresii]|uniref:phage virion morphogenesis protein n=1 Tax=Actinobacillus lignieresii TaxID=720 RepID=UPI000E1FC630
MITITANQKSLNALRNDLRVLALPSDIKKQIIQRTAWAIKNDALKNVRRQQSPDGKSWEKRKVGTGKMLLHRARYLNSKLDGDAKGLLYYKLQRTAEISAIHQYGLEDTVSQNQNDKNKVEADKNDPVTPQQVTRLLALGYQIRKRGKYRNATASEIKRSLSMAQAGLIIRVLKKKLSSATNSGKGLKIKMPERPFLDTNEQRNGNRMREQIEKVLTENGIRFK